MRSTYSLLLLSLLNPLPKEPTIFVFLSLLVDWATCSWMRLVVLITKYHPLDILRNLRDAFSVTIGVFMARTNRRGALSGRSAADLPCGHERELHFCSLGDFSVLLCGGGRGQGQSDETGGQ
jgi:hypothetical protein